MEERTFHYTIEPKKNLKERQQDVFRAVVSSRWLYGYFAWALVSYVLYSVAFGLVMQPWSNSLFAAAGVAVATNFVYAIVHALGNAETACRKTVEQVTLTISNDHVEWTYLDVTVRAPWSAVALQWKTKGSLYLGVGDQSYAFRRVFTGNEAYELLLAKSSMAKPSKSG
jgi:hypothetical protein